MSAINNADVAPLRSTARVMKPIDRDKTVQLAAEMIARPVVEEHGVRFAEVDAEISTIGSASAVSAGTRKWASGAPVAKVPYAPNNPAAAARSTIGMRPGHGRRPSRLQAARWRSTSRVRRPRTWHDRNRAKARSLLRRLRLAQGRSGTAAKRALPTTQPFPVSSTRCPVPG